MAQIVIFVLGSSHFSSHAKNMSSLSMPTCSSWIGCRPAISQKPLGGPSKRLFISQFFFKTLSRLVMQLLVNKSEATSSETSLDKGFQSPYYSELSNKHAANLILFEKFFPPTCLIRTYTFIYF